MTEVVMGIFDRRLKDIIPTGEMLEMTRVMNSQNWLQREDLQ